MNGTHLHQFPSISRVTREEIPRHMQRSLRRNLILSTPSSPCRWRNSPRSGTNLPHIHSTSPGLQVHTKKSLIVRSAHRAGTPSSSPPARPLPAKGNPPNPEKPPTYASAPAPDPLASPPPSPREQIACRSPPHRMHCSA